MLHVVESSTSHLPFKGESFLDGVCNCGDCILLHTLELWELEMDRNKACQAISVYRCHNCAKLAYKMGKGQLTAHIMRVTKVQTLSAVACAHVQDYISFAFQWLRACRRQTRSHTASWYASFVSACALKMADCTDGHTCHTTEGVLDLCNAVVSEKNPQIFWPHCPLSTSPAVNLAERLHSIGGLCSFLFCWKTNRMLSILSERECSHWF